MRARAAFAVPILGLLLTGWSSAAWCHSEVAADGFITGLAHPILGVDHLTAMLSVGIVSAQIGGRHIFTIPAAFVIAMVVGSIFGVYGIVWPGVELGIAASVAVLGVVIALFRFRFDAAIVTCIALFFGSLHGHAHGLEIPHAADPVYYAGGFLLSTAAIHLLGVFIGHLLATRRVQGKRLSTSVGASISVVGLLLVSRLILFA